MKKSDRENEVLCLNLDEPECDESQILQHLLMATIRLMPLRHHKPDSKKIFRSNFPIQDKLPNPRLK